MRRLTNTGDLNSHLKSFPSAKERLDLQDKLTRKTGACLWRASHCWTDGNREELVQQISNYINVTIIGKCAYNKVWPGGGEGVLLRAILFSDQD